MKRILLFLIPLLLVTSCAGGTKRDAEHREAENNDADVAFVQQMIPHHQQAIEMAELVPSADASAEVIELATQIKAAQGPEIATMQDWLDDWGAGAMGGHDMAMDDGMLSATELRDLSRVTGAQFDRVWLTGMIGHHEGAVAMANTELDEGKDPAAKKLARTVISGQQKEITTMKGLLE